jgi:hypothetical protein
MAAYLIAFAKVKNANRIPEYSSAAGILSLDIARGPVQAIICGPQAQGSQANRDRTADVDLRRHHDLPNMGSNSKIH